jgi:hypothetical protein
MLASKTVEVGDTTPVLIIDRDEFDGEYVVYLQTRDGVVIGDESVTSSAGFALDAGVMDFSVRVQGESLYGIAQTGTALIGVLVVSA